MEDVQVNTEESLRRMSVERGKKELARMGWLSSIPGRYAAEQMVEIMTSPVELYDEGKSITTRFTDVCDGLRIIICRENTASGDGKTNGIVVEKQKVETEEPDNPFAPKVGTEITVVKLERDYVSMWDLTQLIKTVQEQSNYFMHDPIQIKQVEKWFEGLDLYCERMRNAGLAMKHVLEKAREKGNITTDSDFDTLYENAATTIFYMGEILRDDSDQRKTPVAFNQIYSETTKEYGDKADEKLLPGLKYARFGERAERELPGEAGQEFELMSRMYLKLRGSKHQLSSEEMIATVMERSMPRVFGEFRRTQMEGAEKVRDIPKAMLSTLVLRGIEKTYQELEIPKWLKEFVDADLEDEPTRKRMLESLNMNMDSVTKSYALHSELLARDYHYYILAGRSNDLTVIPEEVTDIFLRKYQDKLQSLGLRKSEINKFSDWWEDRNFFDEKKIALLKSLLVTNYRMEFPEWDGKFSWEENLVGKTASIDEIVEYYLLGEDGQSREKELEFSLFQMGMLTMLAHEMRLNYGGWNNEESFSGLSESSPSQIILGQKLNCLGRSWLLSRAAMKLGVKMFGADTFGHSTTVATLESGHDYIVEPSINRYGEIKSVNPVVDDKGLLLPGERVVEDYRGMRYQVTSPELQIAESILGNFVEDITDSVKKQTVRKNIDLSATSISNIFAGLIGLRHSDSDQIASALGVSKSKMQWMVRRLMFLDPGYPARMRRKVEEGKHTSDFEEFMKRMISEAEAGD